MAAPSDRQRRSRRPYRIKWDRRGPPRLESPGLASSGHQYGSLVDRVTRIFLSMDEPTKERVLQHYRQVYGDGNYAYAKRTIASWKVRQVEQVGLTVMRLLEIVPRYVDLPTKYELARILREDTLARIRQWRVTMNVGSSDS